jgi:hypothetical protein
MCLSVHVAFRDLKAFLAGKDASFVYFTPAIPSENGESDKFLEVVKEASFKLLTNVHMYIFTIGPRSIYVHMHVCKPADAYNRIHYIYIYKHAYIHTNRLQQSTET